MSRVRNWFTVCGMIILLVGCGRNSNPASEYSRVSGFFEGHQNAMRETIKLTSAGKFEHEVFKGKTNLLSEGGTYVVKDNGIELRPFTRFYDPETEVFREAGSSFIVDKYYFIKGPSYISISPWPDGKYELVKTNAPTEETPSSD